MNNFVTEQEIMAGKSFRTEWALEFVSLIVPLDMAVQRTLASKSLATLWTAV